MIFVSWISGSCGIVVDDGMIITGGIYSKEVYKYNEEGSLVSSLPSTIETRYLHGCSKYVNTDNKIVFYFFSWQSSKLSYLQVYLVVGGDPFDGGDEHDSTEILVDGELSWKMVGSLPLGLSGIRATNLDDIVYAMGIFI